MAGLFRLLILILVVVAGYWTYYIFFSTNPYDGIGVAINERLPLKAREYSCTELVRRHPSATPAPAGCENFWAAKL